VVVTHFCDYCFVESPEPQPGCDCEEICCGNQWNMAKGAEGEKVVQGRKYLDVNGDNFVSPMDALAVINYLNQASGMFQIDEVEMGEGEPVVAIDAGQPAMAHAESMSRQTPLVSVIDTSQLVEVINQDGHQQAGNMLSLDLRHEQPAHQSADQAIDSLFAEFDEIGLDSELILELATDIERAWSN